jgi:toxin ParE1/3/4
MKYNFNIRPKALRQLEEIHDWYESKETGLYQRFQLCFEETLERIAKVPLRSPVIHNEMRRINMNTFPYVIFYHIDDVVIVIVSVLHKRRSEDRWPRSNPN